MTVVLMALMSMVIWLSNAYFFSMLVLGVRNLRRNKVPLSHQASLAYGRPHLGRNDDFYIYFLVPCLNEAHVIGQTVKALIGHRNAHAVVVDDGSNDDTARIAKTAGGDDVTVVRRRMPDARRGKGEALNAGLAHVRRVIQANGQDPERVLICVMDADGHLSDGAIAHVAAEFADPKVGGVQLAVRIRNQTSFLTWVQDFYFWAIAAVTQFGRNTTGTVSLGGNGQFTRLTALNEAGDRPWSRCLTEDLDLTITLVLNGWRLVTTPHAAVAQQGVSKLAALVRQRTRWYQGHMSCARRLPEVWHSRKLTHAQATELSLYLLVPWVLDLPWSILWHVALLKFVTHAADYFVTDQGLPMLALSIVAWYLISFGPAVAAAYLHKKRSPSTNWRRALLLGHSFVVMNYLFFICVWRALIKLGNGEKNWAKTAREVETQAESASAQRSADHNLIHVSPHTAPSPFLNGIKENV